MLPQPPLPATRAGSHKLVLKVGDEECGDLPLSAKERW